MRTFHSETEIVVEIPLKVKAVGLADAWQKIAKILEKNTGIVKKALGAKIANFRSRVVKLQPAHIQGLRHDQIVDLIIDEAVRNDAPGLIEIKEIVENQSQIVRMGWGMALMFLQRVEGYRENELNLQDLVSRIMDPDFKLHILEKFHLVLEMVKRAKRVDIIVDKKARNVRIIFPGSISEILKKIILIRG